MKRRMLATTALAALTAWAVQAHAQDTVDVAIVSGISDITQFDGQF